MTLTIQRESIRETLDELKVILPKHWEELALNKDKVPLEPQYEEYLRREDEGSVIYVTVRDNEKLVGYFIGFVAPGLHYKTCLTCTMDIFYVVQDKRGASIGKQLFLAVERILKAMGVDRWFVGAKLHKDASWLFKELGFEPVEIYHSKWLGD